MNNREIKFWKINTSKTELVDIGKAWLIISLAFTFILSGASLLEGGFSYEKIVSFDFLQLFGITLFTAGLGFLLHELAHKFVAQHYGCVAEFRAFDSMLWLALGLAAVIGFLFAAPGAVMIAGAITRRENGIISFAGPITNYILAMFFLGLMFLFPMYAGALAIGFHVNVWLGLFNMIPFGNFDGIKIFQWNIGVWMGMVAFGILIAFVIF